MLIDFSRPYFSCSAVLVNSFAIEFQSFATLPKDSDGTKYTIFEAAHSGIVTFCEIFILSTLCIHLVYLAFEK